MNEKPDNKHAETAPTAGGTEWHLPLPEKLPAPTAWPMVQALGATLLAWGVITSWIISAAGLALFAAGTGGWIARMRHEEGD